MASINYSFHRTVAAACPRLPVGCISFHHRPLSDRLWRVWMASMNVLTYGVLGLR